MTLKYEISVREVTDENRIEDQTQMYFVLKREKDVIYEGDSIWPCFEIMYGDEQFVRECIMARFNEAARGKLEWRSLIEKSQNRGIELEK